MAAPTYLREVTSHSIINRVQCPSGSTPLIDSIGVGLPGPSQIAGGRSMRRTKRPHNTNGKCFAGASSYYQSSSMRLPTGRAHCHPRVWAANALAG